MNYNLVNLHLGEINFKKNLTMTRKTSLLGNYDLVGARDKVKPQKLIQSRASKIQLKTETKNKIQSRWTLIPNIIFYHCMALKSMIMLLLINTVFEELKYFCFIIVLTKTYTNVLQIMYDVYYTAKNGLKYM